MALSSEELRAQWRGDWEAVSDLLPKRPADAWVREYCDDCDTCDHPCQDLAQCDNAE